VLEAYLADLDDLELSQPLPDAPVDLAFNEGATFGGNAGCNTYSGFFQTDGEEITFENIVATEIFCEEPGGIMDQEAIFLEHLEDAEGYRITEDGRLEIILDRLENNQQVEKILLVFFEQIPAQF
jgi:heat shock protein HslJ